MRTSTATTCLAVGLATLFIAPGGDAARAVEGDLSRREARPFVQRFNAVVRDHGRKVNSHRKFFNQLSRQILQNLSSRQFDPLPTFALTGSALDQSCSTVIMDSVSALAELELLVIDFYDDPLSPGEVLEFSADPDGLLARTVDRLNANNARFLSGIERTARKIEKRACAKDIVLDIDILGLPEFMPRQFDRDDRDSTRLTKHRADIVYLLRTGEGPSQRLDVLGFFDFDPLDDDEAWFGLFEADGTEIDRQQVTPFGNGIARGSFSDFGSGAKNVGLDFDLPAEIFADGFESGDVSAWSYTRSP